MKDKVRFQLDMSSANLKRLEALEKSTGAASKAEVIRHALQLYEYVADRHRRGFTFKAVSLDGKEENVVFLVNKS